MPYIERTYRHHVRSDLIQFTIRLRESDLHISADTLLRDEAELALRQCRQELESYLRRDSAFRTALSPIELRSGAPELALAMAEAARSCGVGPMAAVAGAIAEQVGRSLMAHSREVIVENGGDIFLCLRRPRTVSVFAGASPLSQRIGLAIKPEQTPLGVCTSSGTVGPSLSFGHADAVTVVAHSTALADAAATMLGNAVTGPESIQQALDEVAALPGILGALVIIGEQVGAWGEIELIPFSRP